jgi:hypothetical protein
MSMLIHCTCIGLLQGEDMMCHDLFPSCKAFVLEEVASAVLMVAVGIFLLEIRFDGYLFHSP